MIPALTIAITQPLPDNRPCQGTPALHNHPALLQEPPEWTRLATLAVEDKILRVAWPHMLARGGHRVTWSSAGRTTLLVLRVTS